MTYPPKPRVYKFWPDYAQDAFDEREALMRDGNNIAPDQATPIEIWNAATAVAEREIELVKKMRGVA